MCRELRDKLALQAVLRRTHDRAMDSYAAHEDEEEFRELLDPPRILGELAAPVGLPAFQADAARGLWSSTNRVSPLFGSVD